MALNEFTHSKGFKPLILIFAILTFFIFIVSFSVFYTTENFESACGCQLPLWVILVTLSSLGIFVGLLVYYLLRSTYDTEKKTMAKDISKNRSKILNLLDPDMKVVVEILIDNKGKATQNSLVNSSGIDKVKMSRIITKLLRKGIIKKEKSGMTNQIIFNDELLIFFEYQ